MGSRLSRKGFGFGSALRWLLASALALSCGGAIDPPHLGGESHFLQHCEKSCADGLDCISGVCTRGCVVNQASCSDLSPQATCTDQSIEPGAVAVCDQSCSSNADCAVLGAQHRCELGYCRAAAANGGAGGSGGQAMGGSASGGAATGGRAASGGSAGEPQGAQAGQSQGGMGGMNQLLPVAYCEDDVMGDPVNIDASALIANTLTLDVSHGGGCAEHTYSLCYGAFLESNPVQVKLRLINDGHGDNCDAVLFRTLRFDLGPLGAAYEQAYQTTGGLISTEYGLYSFGAASCEDRTKSASSQVQAAIARADVSCETNDDCQLVWPSTTCTATCSSPISKNGADALTATIEAIDAGVCGDYAGAGCTPPGIPPCFPAIPSCVQGKCVDGQP